MKSRSNRGDITSHVVASQPDDQPAQCERRQWEDTPQGSALALLPLDAYFSPFLLLELFSKKTSKREEEL